MSGIMNMSAEILLFGKTDSPVVKALEEPIHPVKFHITSFPMVFTVTKICNFCPENVNILGL